MNIKLTLSLATILLASCCFAQGTQAIFADLGASMDDVTYRSGHTRPYATVTVDIAKLRGTVAASLTSKVSLSPKEFDAMFASSSSKLWEFVEVLDVCELDGKEATRRSVVAHNPKSKKIKPQRIPNGPMLLVVEDWEHSPESARFAVRFRLKEFASELLKVNTKNSVPVFIIHAAAPNADPILVNDPSKNREEEDNEQDEYKPITLNHSVQEFKISTNATQGDVTLVTAPGDGMGGFQLNPQGEIDYNEAKAHRFDFSFSKTFTLNPIQFLFNTDKYTTNSFEFSGKLSTAQLDREGVIKLAWKTDSSMQLDIGAAYSEFSVQTTPSLHLSKTNFEMGMRFNDLRAKVAGESDSYIRASKVKSPTYFELGVILSYAVPRGFRDIPSFDLDRGSVRPVARLVLEQNESQFFSLFGKATVIYFDRALGPAEDRDLRLAEYFELGTHIGKKGNRFEVSYKFGRELNNAFGFAEPNISVSYSRKF